MEISIRPFNWLEIFLHSNFDLFITRLAFGSLSNNKIQIWKLKILLLPIEKSSSVMKNTNLFIFSFFFSCSTKLNYDPYETVIDLVIDLGLMCSGMFYCPLLPIIICSKLCFGKEENHFQFHEFFTTFNLLYVIFNFTNFFYFFFKFRLCSKNVSHMD